MGNCSWDTIAASERDTFAKMRVSGGVANACRFPNSTTDKVALLESIAILFSGIVLVTAAK